MTSPIVAPVASVIVALGLAAAHYGMRSYYRGDGSERTEGAQGRAPVPDAMLDHLQDFYRIWLLLGVFYAVDGFYRVVIKMDPVEVLPVNPGDPGYWPILCYHVVAMGVCAQTNFWLRRANAHMERIRIRTKGEWTGALEKKVVRKWSFGVSIVAGLSLGVLVFVTVTGATLGRAWLAAVYAPQMLIG